MLNLGEIILALKYTKTVSQQNFLVEVVFTKTLKPIRSDSLLM